LSSSSIAAPVRPVAPLQEKTHLPIRDYELAVELTYQAKIMSGFYIQPDFQYIFYIQPDFQYIFRPRGGALNPLNPAAGRIPDAAVFGLRTMINF
jgi:porin